MNYSNSEFFQATILYQSFQKLLRKFTPLTNFCFINFVLFKKFDVT